MFTIGISEPLQSQALIRHSIVWLGGAFGETNLGLPAAHPLSDVVLRLEERFEFVGSWLLCRRVASLREFERKALLLRLERARWDVEPRRDTAIRACKTVSEGSPWPYPESPGLPFSPSEILVVGATLGYAVVHCTWDESAWTRPVEGEHLVLQSDFASWLISNRAFAVCFGRTQTDFSPGISIIGSHALDPRGFVAADEIHALHWNDNGGRAWSHGRIRNAQG
jgi:hypothetical protein